MNYVRQIAYSQIIRKLIDRLRSYFVMISLFISVIIGVFVPAVAESEQAADSLIFGEISIVSERPVGTAFVRIQQEFSNEFVKSNRYEELTAKLMQIPVRDGYYFPVLHLESVSPGFSDGVARLNPVFQLGWGEITQIDTILFEGVKKTKPAVIRRMVKDYIGKRYSPALNEQLNRSFRRFPFLTVNSANEIVKTREGKTAILISMRELQENEFGGVVGYVPETYNRKGYFTGELDLKFHNLSGTGRQLFLYWSKTNRYSQQIRMSYTEPWIWKSDMFGTADFEQVLRDTLVVIRKLGVSAGFYSFKRGSIELSVSHESTLPTPGGRNLFGLVQTKTNAVGLKYGIDRRNNFYNPARGFALNTTYSAGIQQRDSLDNKVRSEVMFNSEIYFPLKTDWVMAAMVHARAKWLTGEESAYSDQYWFGGAGSLRGYPNDFFRGSQIAWTTFEIRRLFGNLSSFFLFFDQGYFRRKELTMETIRYPNSFGVGIRLFSRMGIIGLDYGFGRGDTFSTAKIHVRLINRF